MSWGNYIELYVAVKNSEKEMGETVAFINTRGEIWDKNSVLSFAKHARRFSQMLDEAIEKHGAENICIRTNI